MRTKMSYYSDPNDECFRRYFAEQVKQHGREWVVIAGGEVIGVGPEEQVGELRQKARDRYPDDTPLLSPIPTVDDIECILSSTLTR